MQHGTTISQVNASLAHPPGPLPFKKTALQPIWMRVRNEGFLNFIRSHAISDLKGDMSVQKLHSSPPGHTTPPISACHGSKQASTTQGYDQHIHPSLQKSNSMKRFPILTPARTRH